VPCVKNIAKIHPVVKGQRKREKLIRGERRGKISGKIFKHSMRLGTE
jgi:hypothetical protein